ncbi:hypothetical protein HMPREF9552_05015, partial [Escherichia coli MS 198-1]
AQARLFRADAGLTALKRLYKGAAGSPVVPFSLLALYGLNNQTARKAVSLRERG